MKVGYLITILTTLLIFGCNSESKDTSEKNWLTSKFLCLSVYHRYPIEEEVHIDYSSKLCTELFDLRIMGFR